MKDLIDIAAYGSGVFKLTLIRQVNGRARFYSARLVRSELSALLVRMETALKADRLNEVVTGFRNMNWFMEIRQPVTVEKE